MKFERHATLASLIVGAVVLLLDSLTPLGYAVPMLYVLPILITWLIPGWRSTVLIALGVFPGTIVGTLLSPGQLSPEAVANRLLATVLLWTVAALVIKQKQLAKQTATAREAMDQSDQRLQLFIRHAPAAIAMFDTNMCYVATSQRWLTDYGLDGQHLIGRSHYDVFPEIPERWKDVHRRCLAGAVERADEDLFMRSDGSQQWLRWEIRPWRTDPNVIGGIIIFTEDITVHKQADEKLRTVNMTLDQRVRERTAQLAESNERLDWVLRATNDGVWDWDLVQDTLHFSSRWKEMHGFQESDPQESMQEWASRIHPNDRKRVLDRLEDYLAEKSPAFSEEYRIQRRDGTYFWVLDRGAALWDEAGRAIRIVGAETDITWRKDVEESLRRREHEFRMLADNVPAFFGYIDRERRYRFVNKRYEEIFGRCHDAIVGTPVHELLGPRAYDEVRPYLDQAFSGQRAVFEYRLTIPGATDYWFSAQYVPDRNNEGTITGVFVLLADVTTLKQSEAVLREREAQLQALSAKLVQLQEEERRRIARDLHDDFMQRLAAMTLDLHSCSTDQVEAGELKSRLGKLGASAEQLTTDLQKLAHDLHPSIIEHAGLEAAVQEQVSEFAARTGLTAEVIVRDVRGSSRAAMPPASIACCRKVCRTCTSMPPRRMSSSASYARIGASVSACMTTAGASRAPEKQAPERVLA